MSLAATTTTSLSADTAAEILATYTGDPQTDPATNYVDIHFGLLVATHTVAVILTTLCVGLRVYVRRFMVKEVALDDWALIAAYIAFLTYIGFDFAYGILVTIHGLEEVYWFSFQLTSWWEIPFWLSTVLVRGAIAAFFLRAIPKYEYLWQRRAIAATFWIYTLFMTVYTFVNIYQCGDPLAYSWTDNPTCLNQDAMAILPVVARAVTMILDWLMTLLPVIIVVKSSMPRRAKVSVVSLMILAGGGSTVSILRIVYNSLGSLGGPTDFPHYTLYTILALWENGAAIMVVSLAATRPLFEKFIDTIATCRTEASHSSGEGVFRFGSGSTQGMVQNAANNKGNVVFLTESELM